MHHIHGVVLWKADAGVCWNHITVIVRMKFTSSAKITPVDIYSQNCSDSVFIEGNCVSESDDEIIIAFDENLTAIYNRQRLWQVMQEALQFTQKAFRHLLLRRMAARQCIALYLKRLILPGFNNIIQLAHRAFHTP